MLSCIVVDSETNRLNFAITANCIVVGYEINRLNFATVLNETGKLTAQVKFQEPAPVANTSESYRFLYFDTVHFSRLEKDTTHSIEISKYIQCFYLYIYSSTQTYKYIYI